ncbi:MAG: TetR/AcrR family transcriptional regulator [Rikenellaceae bacterium]|nr:TetR/AcrR family transcriptional regulator [Rikenellaceae bacterium]
MSKIIDETKIERIRESAINCIGRNGIGNASVADIARNAGVSAGYLYRHYSGKDELINDILEKTLDIISDKIEELINSGSVPEKLINDFIMYLFETAEKNSDKIKFILSLQNDFSYSFPDKLTARLEEFCSKIIRKGNDTGIITKEIAPGDMYIILICVPLQYIGMELRDIFGNKTEKNETIKKLTSLCLAAIK